MAVRRGMRTLAVLVSCSTVVLGAVAASGSVAQVGAHPDVARAKIPSGVAGGLTAVAAVPHSSDVWTIGANGSGVDNEHFFELRRHDGHVERIKPPKLNGRYGNLEAITAASPKSVWLAGATQQGHGSVQAFPAIWRWSRGKWVAQKLPAMEACACSVSSISASSASNVWAAGVIYVKAGNAASLLHFNGKKWSAVPDLIAQGSVIPSVVSTSGPKNAWEAAGPDFAHWNGKVWTADGTAPSVDSIVGIATSSPKLAYAVEEDDTTFTGVILKYNGSTWSRTPLPDGHAKRAQLTSVSMHGTSAWVVGAYNNPNDVRLPIIVHTTGGKWKSQTAPWRDVVLAGVSAQSAKRAVVAGSYIDFDSRATKSFIALDSGHWTGINS
jgi:hypothetical protein